MGERAFVWLFWGRGKKEKLVLAMRDFLEIKIRGEKGESGRRA